MTTESYELELLMDRHGLADLLHMLATICNEKAEHVQTNWQDKALAKAWERNGEKLMACAGKLDLVS